MGINALESTWDFADNAAVYTALAKAEKLSAIGYENDLNLWTANEAAIYDAFEYTDSTVPTKAEFLAASASYDSILAATFTDLDEAEAFNSSHSLSVSVVLCLAAG